VGPEQLKENIVLPERLDMTPHGRGSQHTGNNIDRGKHRGKHRNRLLKPLPDPLDHLDLLRKCWRPRPLLRKLSEIFNGMYLPVNQLRKDILLIHRKIIPVSPGLQKVTPPGLNLHKIPVIGALEIKHCLGQSLGRMLLPHKMTIRTDRRPVRQLP